MKFLSPTFFGGHSRPPDFFLTPTKTRPSRPRPFLPFHLTMTYNSTDANMPQVQNSPFSHLGNFAPCGAGVLVRSGREGTASAVPQPKTFSFLSFRTALAVRNLLLPRAGCPGLAIFETWETKGSGTLTRRLAEGSLACIFRKIRVSICLQAHRKQLGSWMPLNSLPFVIPNRFSGEESALPQPGCPGLAIFETRETKSSGTLARRFAKGSGVPLP